MTPPLSKRSFMADLVRFLQGRLAHFMVPKYVRVTSRAAKDAHAKVQKGNPARRWDPPDTWDRESDPTISVRRERLEAGQCDPLKACVRSRHGRADRGRLRTGYASAELFR